MEFAAATVADLNAVWPRLARRTTTEYALAQVSMADAKAMFREWIEAGTAVAITDDQVPVAILAWLEDGDGVATSFAGTEEFFEPRFVRPFRRYLHALQLNIGNTALFAHSFSEHHMVPKWFKTLGYRMKTENPPYRLFVLDPQ